MHTKFLLLVLLANIAFAEVARAQGSNDLTANRGSAPAAELDPDSRPATASAMLYIPWYWGFGIGVIGRYEFPILPQGFVDGSNDEVSIEPSLGFAYSNYGLESLDIDFFHLTPAVYGLWSFYLSPQFRMYGGLGLGYSIAFYSGDISGTSLSYFFWDAVVGLIYAFGDRLAFRAELGYQGPKLGLTLSF